GFGGVVVWRGGVNAWECDEMGHMNSRFYVARCMEGMALLFALAGLRPPCRPQVASMHIRFHREAPVGTQLHIQAGFARVGTDDAGLVLLMLHQDGRLAASFRVTVRSIDGDGAHAPWPAALDADDFAIATPPEALARSLPGEAEAP